MARQKKVPTEKYFFAGGLSVPPQRWKAGHAAGISLHFRKQPTATTPAPP